ncbi:MAG: tetratricopeptide repeat protein [Bacteroidales bacterium]|nr:tetratricopeptide repeat protein [Bacteroidales bacterium]
MDIKPVVSEEQRKYIVQANSLTNDKLYKQAIDAYKKALAINPVAYPAAYYNMALLFAEKQDLESKKP